jgi:hypothetical protein
MRNLTPWAVSTAVGLVCLVGAVHPLQARAATIVSVDFASGHTSGNLVGQQSWAQTGSTTTNPIQVTSGTAVVGTSGQDVYKPFPGGALTPVAGEVLMTRLDFTPTAAQATGDYFFHVSDPAGTTNNFYQRLFGRLVSGSLQLGLSTNSTTGNYGTGLYPLSQPITAVMKWSFITGATNDTIELFVNPVDPLNPSGAAYASVTWSTSEPATLAAVNFRQGNASNAPSLAVTDLAIETVAVVPEPSAIVLLAAGCGALGCLVRRPGPG